MKSSPYRRNRPSLMLFAAIPDLRKTLSLSLKGVDLLYHKSTFLKDLKEMADYTGHSTAEEAATIAQKAGVKKLILGHFSNRYSDYSVFTDEARGVFPETYLPKMLERIEIG